MKKFLHVLFAATLVLGSVQISATTLGGGGAQCCANN
jgi:hypothetical protein